MRLTWRWALGALLPLSALLGLPVYGDPSTGKALGESYAIQEDDRLGDESDDKTTWGEVVIGPQYYIYSEKPSSAKFEEFRQVPNDLVVGRFIFSWRPRESWYLDLEAIDISQLDQRLSMDFGRLDRWKGEFYWRENPRQWTDQAFQLFNNQGDGVFSLDDAFQATVQAAPPGVDTNGDGNWDPGTKSYLIETAVDCCAAPVTVAHQRATGGFGFQYTPTRNWTFSVEGERSRRNGTAPQSLGMYFTLAPAEVSSQIDFRTDTEAVRAEYSHKSFNVGGQVLASQFETGFTSLTWDDQLFLNDVAVNANAANPGHGRMTTSTDNEMIQYSLFGGLNLPGHTRIDASFMTGQTKQNDPFQPMTINSLLIAAPLPAESLDGEYRTDLAQVRVSSRPLKIFRWSAWWRDYEMDNRTPSLIFADYVQTDYQFPLCGNANACGATTNRIARRNLPYSFARSNLGASVGFTPLPWLDATLSYDREEAQREFSAVEDSTEDNYRLTIDFDVTEWLSIRTMARYSVRSTDEYDAEYFEESFPIGEAIIAPTNEGSRRFYWTDRDANVYALYLDITPAPNWSIYGEATYWNYEYSDPTTGKSIGESYTVQEDRNFDGTDETYDIRIAGRTEDTSRSYTLGVSVAPTRRFSVFADYTWEEWKYGLATRYRNVVAGIGTDDPLDNWNTQSTDKYETGTIGFVILAGAHDGIRINCDASQSYGTGTIHTDFVPGGAPSGDTNLTSFPLLKSRLTIIDLSLRQVLSKNLAYSVTYWYESWRDDNFASDQNEPYMGQPGNDTGSANAIYLGLDFKNYSNDILQMLLHYTF